MGEFYARDMLGLVVRIRSTRGLVAVQAYNGLVRDMRALLLAVDQDQAGTAWGVRHEQDWPGLALRFEPLDPSGGNVRAAAAAVGLVEGVRQLDVSPRIPVNFTDAAVTTLSRVAQRRGAEGVDGLGLAAANGHVQDEAEVTDAVALHALEAVATASSDFSGVEGVVDALAGGAKSKRSAVVLDRHSGQRVRVRLRDEHVPLVRDAWGERIAVHGEVSYNRSGQPIRVVASDVMVLPPLAGRGKLKDIIGASPGWTAGRPVKDVLDEMRRRA